jgi:hypothetical protein
MKGYLDEWLERGKKMTFKAQVRRCGASSGIQNPAASPCSATQIGGDTESSETGEVHWPGMHVFCCSNDTMLYM